MIVEKPIEVTVERSVKLINVRIITKIHLSNPKNIVINEF